MAQTIRPVLQIGKNSISEGLIDNINLQLEAHELIKVSLLQNSPIEIEEAAAWICEETGCELVQIIGRQMVFYRQSKKLEKDKRIELPR